MSHLKLKADIYNLIDSLDDDTKAILKGLGHFTSDLSRIQSNNAIIAPIDEDTTDELESDPEPSVVAEKLPRTNRHR